MTREEAKRRLEVWLKCMDCPEDKQCYDSHLHSTCEYTDYCDETPVSEAVKMAVKALEQEPILDKIRAEIDNAKLPKNRMSFFRDGINTALEIIDKYRQEGLYECKDIQEAFKKTHYLS